MIKRIYEYGSCSSKKEDYMSLNIMIELEDNTFKIFTAKTEIELKNFYKDVMKYILELYSHLNPLLPSDD